LPVLMDSPGQRGGLERARRLLEEASRASSEGRGAEACRAARVAAQEALHAILKPLGVECTGSLVAGLQRAKSAGLDVPPHIMRQAHILDPHMHEATRHGAEREASLGDHGGECEKAARAIVEWAEGLSGGASRA